MNGLQRVIARAWRAAFLVEVWNLGLARVDLRALVAGGGLECFRELRWMRVRPRVRLRGDPVFWQAPDGLRVLYEELPLLDGRASIYSLRLTDFERGARARREFSAGWHLSYPQLFEAEGRRWCLAEGACSGALHAWPWDESRRAWGEPLRVLEGPVIDPTLLSHAGRWWLFGTMRGTTVDTMLHLWSAPGPLGPWMPHPRGPFASARGTARGAGPIFEVDGRLYRPSQDGRRGYGGELCVNRIERLDEGGYEETEVARVAPDPEGPYPFGLHTLATHGEQALIDGKTYLFHPLAALSKLLWRVRSAA